MSVRLSVPVPPPAVRPHAGAPVLNQLRENIEAFIDTCYNRLRGTASL